MTTWLGVGVSFADVEVVEKDNDFEDVADVTLLEEDLEVDLVWLDEEEDFGLLELETEDADDLEVLVALVTDGDFEIVRVEDGFVLVVNLEGESVLLLDGMDVFDVAELEERVDDFDVAELDKCDDEIEVVPVLDELDDDFNVVEPERVEDEDSCELDLVPERLFKVDERELELPGVVGFLDVINPEELTLKLGETEELRETLLRLDDEEPLPLSGTACIANAAFGLNWEL